MLQGGHGDAAGSEIASASIHWQIQRLEDDCHELPWGTRQAQFAFQGGLKQVLPIMNTFGAVSAGWKPNKCTHQSISSFNTCEALNFFCPV